MNVISMSLWGSRRLYVEGALANARLVPVIYPGWTLRLYCSTEVTARDALRSLGVDVRVVAGAPGHAGLFWRFRPAGEPDIEHVIVRDADSRLNVREKAAVDAWIASGLPFHVMRDHAFHRETPMLAGMWGCRGGALADIGARLAAFERGADKHDDTIFLRDHVWPRIKDRCLVHTSVPDPLGGDPFPPHAPFDGFVGEIIDPDPDPVVALLLPSRGRPAAALAAAQSALETAAAPDALRLLVGVEPDEVRTYRDAFGRQASWIRPLERGGSYVRAIRELHASTEAAIYGLCADDFRFETAGWDARIRRAVAELPGRLGLVYGDDGLQGERLATAPFLTEAWIACVADILPGRYDHMFCDTEVTAIAKRAGLLRYLPDVRITPRHPAAGAATGDATYARVAATMASGRAEFDRRAPARQRLADRLTRATRPGAAWSSTGSGLLSLAQQRLLTAAFAGGEPARQAWGAWVDEVGIGRADSASARLFPAVWWNLIRPAVDGSTTPALPDVDALRRHYRESWAATRGRLQAMREAVSALQTSGIPVLLAGETALALCHYARPELRPARDVALVVPAAHAGDAQRVLASLGWRPRGRAPIDAFPPLRAIALEDREGRRVRLGWPARAGEIDATAEGLWARAARAEIDGMSIAALSPIDLLMSACVNGQHRRRSPAVHWMADVLAILRTAGPALDWDRLAAEAHAARVAPPLRRALECVRAIFDLPVLEAASARRAAGIAAETAGRA